MHDRPPHDLSPIEIEALLGRGAMERWDALPRTDRDRIAADLEALQRTAREVADATRQLHEDVDTPTGPEQSADAGPSPERR
jgi:hypothetical protein